MSMFWSFFLMKHKSTDQWISPSPPTLVFSNRCTAFRVFTTDLRSLPFFENCEIPNEFNQPLDECFHHDMICVYLYRGCSKFCCPNVALGPALGKPCATTAPFEGFGCACFRGPFWYSFRIVS